MKLAKAVLGAAVAGIALAGSTATRAEPPVYVTLKEAVLPMLLWWPPTSVLCFLGDERSGWRE